MPLPRPPFDIVADELVNTLQAFPWADYLDGSDDEPLPKIRHWRGVNADESEYPALLVRVDSDDPFEGDVGDGYGVPGELRMNLSVSLIIDDYLPTSISEEDKTGLGNLGAFAAIAMRAWKAAVANYTPGLGDVADNIEEAGRGPDPDNSSDEGRLVQSAIIAYRVLEEDPTVLLRRGANA